MMETNKKGMISAIFILFFCLNSVGALGAQSDPGFSQLSADSVYQFSTHLPKAATWVKNMKGKEKHGIFQNGVFSFEGMSEKSQILVEEHLDEMEKEHRLIKFWSLRNVTRVLEFYDVVPASKLKLLLAVMSDITDDEDVSYLNFTVWLGSRKIKEFRLSNRKSWSHVEVPLGVYSFMNRPGSFRFELLSDSPMPVEFYFGAELAT